MPHSVAIAQRRRRGGEEFGLPPAAPILVRARKGEWIYEGNNAGEPDVT